MPLDECVVLTPCRSVHTLGMKMAIDVAAVAGDGVVLAVREAVRPGRP